MNKRKTTLCLLAAAAAVSLPAAKPLYTEGHGFEGKATMNTWPNSQNKYLSADMTQGAAGSKGALKIAKPTGGMTLYSGMRYKETGPGVAIFSFYYKFNGQAVPIKGTLRFNKPKGGNGSAGQATFQAPAGTAEYQHYRGLFDVPPETVASQYLLSFSGAESEIYLDNVTMSFIPDTTKISKVAAVKFNESLENRIWNPQLIRHGFYNQGKMAVEDTGIQLAADNKGIYIAFRNYMAGAPKGTVTQQDGKVWDDDNNVVFFFNEKEQKGWQFMVNPLNTRTDGALIQRVPGDPWRFNPDWNSKFQTAAKRTDYGWESRFFIPWQDLNLNGKDPFEMIFNFARENKSAHENSTFNSYIGNFADMANWGKLTFDGKQLTFKRTRNLEVPQFAVKRPNAKFAELLQKGTPGKYSLDVWSHGADRSGFPAVVMKRTSDEVWQKWLGELYRAWGEAGMGGRPWPWALVADKAQLFHWQVKKYNTKVPFFTDNSDHARNANKNGAVYTYPGNDHTVDVVDPEFRKALTRFVKGYVAGKEGPLVKATTKLGMGPDEPSNSIPLCFNPALNTANKAALDKLDAEIRRDYGYGKYGNFMQPGVSAADRPFARIAFFRWWNAELHKSLAMFQKNFKEVLPDVPYHLMTDNNVSGQSVVDVANLNDIAELIACDPYPTSTAASYGMARAIYHTGFSTRVLHDLVSNARIITMPQCFIYHGRHGNVNDMREWASQALKNGAEHLFWYCGGAPWEIFDDYAGMLEISKFIGSMDKLPLPEKTNTLIWYSNFDQWGAEDTVLHSAYTVYAILGEQLKSNFRFVSDSSITKKFVNLDDYKLLYIPRMQYTTPEISAKLVNWVKNGGTLVVLDPLFMQYNLDGSINTDRQTLIGCAVPQEVKKLQTCVLDYQGKKVTPAPAANCPAPVGSHYISYVLPQVKGAKTVMTYPDNTPAAIERQVGKGKVIAFAIQPFGGSEAAIAPGAWKDFFAAQARLVNEKTGLGHWDFLIPPVKPTIKLQRIIK